MRKEQAIACSFYNQLFTHHTYAHYASPITLRLRIADSGSSNNVLC